MSRGDAVRVAALGVLLAGVVCLLVFAPDDRQSGGPVPGDPRASQGAELTTYCLPDGSGVRMYERPFPAGGTQPLFAVLYAGDLPAGNPARCEAGR